MDGYTVGSVVASLNSLTKYFHSFSISYVITWRRITDLGRQSDSV